MPTETNFLLVETSARAEPLAARLRGEFAVHVRPCGAVSLPRHLRVGVCRGDRLPSVTDALLTVLHNDAARWRDA